MKFFQKKSVAILVMVLAIALAAAWGLAHRPAAVPEGGAPLDTTLSTDYYRTYIVDDAGVLSEHTEEALALYDANWDQWSGSILSVVTVPSASSAEEAAWDWAERLQLGEDDAILLLDTGGQDAYLLSSGAFQDRFGGTESNYLGAYLYEDFMAGEYDTGVQNLFAQVHLLFSGGGSSSRGETFSGIIMLVVMVAVMVLILSILDRMRYNAWFLLYGGMPVPPVVFRPILWWHRPGSFWWRHRPPPPPRGPGRRPPSGGAFGSRPPRGGASFGSGSFHRGGGFGRGGFGGGGFSRGGGFGGRAGGGFRGGRGGGFRGRR